jgi:hypothetical protein
MLFSPHFHSKLWEERSRGGAKIGGGLERKQEVKIERLTWFSSLLHLKHDLFFLSIFYSLLHDVWVVYLVSRVCRSNLMLCNGSCMSLWFELIDWVSLIVYSCFYLDWDCLIDSWLSTDRLSMTSLFVIWPWWTLQLKLSTWGRSLINVNRKMKFLELIGSGCL